MKYQWDTAAAQKFEEVKPFIDRLDGHHISEILCSYNGYSHPKFVAKFIDLLMDELRGPRKFLGSEIILDSTMPKDEIKLISGGVEVGRIIGLAR